MESRFLGNTGIKISEVGFGAAALFGKDVLGKQGITEEQAYELILAAINHGVAFFDTGINYGYAEERLGRCIARAISEKYIKRNDLILETKCGETINQDGTYGPRDLSPDWIKKSIEISLRRLNIDYIDLYALHGECDIADVDPIVNTFEDLKSQKLIRAYGVNTFNTEFINWMIKNPVFDYVMLDYNIMRQDRESQIDGLTKAGVGVIAGSALGESLYSKNVFHIKNRNDLWYMARAIVRFKDLMNKSRNYKFLTKQEGFTANQLALRYVLDNKKITSACFSTINKNHMLENLKAVDIAMPDDILKEIKKRA